MLAIANTFSNLWNPNPNLVKNINFFFLVQATRVSFLMKSLFTLSHDKPLKIDVGNLRKSLLAFLFKDDRKAITVIRTNELNLTVPTFNYGFYYVLSNNKN